MMLHEKIRSDLTTLGYKGMLQSFEENLELKTLSSSFQQSLYRIIQAEVAHRASRCVAGHGAKVGGESPLWAKSNRSTSLGKGVHREVESEGSR